MVQSLIEQLQLGAVDGAAPITDLLRRAKLAAVKLKTQDFATWVDLEINGYTDQPVVPDYRLVRGVLKFLNPHHGWQPILGLENLRRGIVQPIGEIAELSKIDSGFLTVAVTDGLRRRIVDQIGFQCDVQLHVSTVAVGAVVEAVRNKVLDWTLQLEAVGITGQGLTFTPEETKAAQSMTVQHHYHGPIASIAQGSSHVCNVSQTNSSATLQELADAVLRLMNAISASAVVDPKSADAIPELAASEKELRGGRVPLGRVKKAMEAIGTVEDIAIRAPEVASRLHDLWQMFGLT